MAKSLKDDPVTQSDMIDFLNGYSDFSFEIQVLKILNQKGFSCEHGGSYIDRATRKAREFDIRATKIFNHHQFLRLAIECKNLRPNFPLLVSCVPRPVDESFHEIVMSVDPDKISLEKKQRIPPLHPTIVRSKTVRLSGEHSLYKPGDPVGKSCAQVGRTKDKEIYQGDFEVYEKWSQALSSADDLTYLACTDGLKRTGNFAYSLVFPLLVVPNGSLWMTLYDSEGNRIKDPERVDRCSYFVHLTYLHALSGHGELTISHLEFVTVDGLTAFVDEVSGDDAKLNTSFPIALVDELLRGTSAG